MLDRDTKLHVQRSLGIKHFNLSNFTKALEHHQLELDNANDAGDKAGQSLACAYIGRAHFSLGNMKMAIVYQLKRLSIADEVGDKVGQGRACAHLGRAYHSLGEFNKALEYYQKRLSIAKEVEDKSVLGGAHANLGIAYQSLGEFEKAIKHHKLDLSIAEDVEDKVKQGRAYANLGVAYHSLGHFKTALEYHRHDLRIAEEVGDIAAKGRAYGNIGISYSSLGEFNNALTYHKKEVNIAEKVGDKTVLAGANVNLGNSHRSLKNFEKAEECYELHRKIAEEVGDKAGQGGAYANLGLIQRDLGKFQKALEYHQLELCICKECGDKVGQGRAYANLGRDYHFLEDFNKALECHQQDLQISKDCKAMSGQARALCNLGRVYHSRGDLPNAEYHFKSSVSVCEEIRDLLHSEDDWKIKLRELYKDAYNALLMVQLKQNKIVKALQTAEQGRAQALFDLMKSRYDLELALSGTSGEMETIISGVTSNNSSQTIFITGGRRAINLWVLGKGHEIGFVQKTINEDNLEFLIKETYQDIGVVPPEAHDKGAVLSDSSMDTLKIWYDMLISPIAELIQSSEIIIVPDGLLFLVPFAALKDQHAKYLSEQFRIRLTPSLTSLQLTGKCPERYHSTTGALLVGDPYVGNIKIPGIKVEQLESAKEEVEMIGKELNTTPLIGEEATKVEVLRRIDSVSLVHIAAHGLKETGEIILSTSSKKPKKKDFLLTMKDVLDAKLQAQLVVLSCCHTSRGEIMAEGVVGIARAFLGAGARSVVATLWAIDDKATKEFMKHFYQHLLEGDSVSKSLNKAMKYMRESANFSDVKYWAPFALIGDDVTLNLGQTRWECSLRCRRN